MIWATVSFQSCFWWLYSALPLHPGLPSRGQGCPTGNTRPSSKLLSFLAWGHGQEPIVAVASIEADRQRSAPYPLWKNLETVTIHSDNCVKQKLWQAFVVAAACPPDSCTTLTPLMLASSPRMFLIRECFLPFLKKSASFIPSGIYIYVNLNLPVPPTHLFPP